ncbi:adenosylcobinamide-phosphate synthase CbiB [Mesorhizobium sp. 2RAF21]|uniref:adenosylcobinamide-phosphate synthase CbiB n=1 Tax=Mesorhizobium sp. 2RAF21 TaxID=3232995 RepID=UPI003F97BE21
MFLLIAFLSMTIELVAGYPDRLFERIGHPVSWIGTLIGTLDRKLNDAKRSPRASRVVGVLTLVVLVLIAGGTALLVQRALSGSIALLLVTALVASTLIAQRSLAKHVAAVAQALEIEGVARGRCAVSQIVGRDPQALDEAGVSRAAIESLAENFSDGIVAPSFWLAAGGLPGAAIYKAVNTADSMIGHRTQRHEAFGWAVARFDDLINLPASRLTALLIVVAAGLLPGMSAGDAWRAVWRDAGRHRSPNAGWPEAAMAGALGLALAGPRHYGGVLVDDAFMGVGGRRAANAVDIRAALRLYWTADLLLVTLLGIGAALVTLHG